MRIERDKVLHFVVSCGLSLILYGLFRSTIAFGLVFGLGLGRELAQLHTKQNTLNESLNDMIANILGIGVAICYVLVVRKIIG
jgi:hypothetical protein